MSPAKTPIIVGVGQWTNRPSHPSECVEPLEMMARSVDLAIEDCATKQIVAALDSITVINLISHPYADPAAQLASRIGATPSEALTTSMGGNSPQWRINEMADRIASGECKAALISGGEAFHSLRIARKAGVEVEWGPRGAPGMIVGNDEEGSNELEKAHNVHLPIRIYPLFENALRAAAGRSIDEQHLRIGRLCAGLSTVAADNPHAWFREAKTQEQIIADTPDNRMICFPYRKYMNAIMTVDQSASLILTSTEQAKTLGIPTSKWVYLSGCGDAHDLWHLSDRINYHTSPAIQLAARRALDQSGIEASDLTFADFYSCFPSALQIGAQMVGVADDGSIPLTTTGGLPYHGGPGSNYSTHAVGQMVGLLRKASDESYGIVTGIGWYMTKHSLGIYSNEEPRSAWSRHDVASDQAKLDAMEHPKCVERAKGNATLETYTVIHERDGTPTLGLAALRMANGDRCWANIRDSDLLQEMESTETIGKPCTVHPDDANDINIVEM